MMKYSLTLLTLMFFSFPSFAVPAPSKKDKIPATIIIKKDQNGEVYVYRSSKAILPIQEGDEDMLSRLKFERLSDVTAINLGKKSSKTKELDEDLPRQSWYTYWNYGYGYYPIYYLGYAYNYSYYPYYYYDWNNCNYYWYGWNGGRSYPGYGYSPGLYGGYGY